MHRRAQAWGLWLVSAIVVAMAAGAVVHAVQQRRARMPLTAPTLHLPIDELRSQAEEGRVLVRLARDGELGATFTRQHARQLAQRVQAAADQLPRPDDLLKQADDAKARAAARPSELARPPAAATGGVFARLLAALKAGRSSRGGGQAPPVTAADSPAARAASAAATEAAQAAAAANEARRARRAADNAQRALQRLADAAQPSSEFDVAEPVLGAAARELGFLASATEVPQ
jgi:hypothetical protein